MRVKSIGSGCVETSGLVNLKIRQLTAETCCLLLRSSSVNPRIVEMIGCLAENNRFSVEITEVSGKRLILRISGCNRKTKRSGNIFVFRKRDDFTVINLCNGGNKVECMVSLRGWEKGCASFVKYRGDITEPEAVSAFKGLLSLAQKLVSAKSKKRSPGEVSCR
jgi:hypothetical protein